MTIRNISILIAGLGIFASLFGIFGDIYTDHPWTVAQLIGQDVATIIIAAVLILLTRFNNAKVILVQTGIFGYFTYTYITYTFGPTLNIMFLPYVAIVSLSVLGLIVTFGQIGKFKISGRPSVVFTISGIYLIVLAGMLGCMWLADLISTMRGTPLFANPSGEPFLTVYALDLGFVVPISLVAAIQLFRKKQLGYILTTFMLVKSTTVGLALIAMALSLALKNYGLDIFLTILWFVIGGLGLVLSIITLKQLQIE